MAGGEVLGILGVALAWKGLVDFCNIVVDLLKNDPEDRNRLRLRAQCTNQLFSDWGVKYGIEDTDNGAFYQFREDRQKLILEVLKQQMDDTGKVVRMLDTYHATDAAAGAGTSELGVEAMRNGRKFKRGIDAVKVRMKKSANKISWNAVNRRQLEEYVLAMTRNAECLNQLVYLPHDMVTRAETDRAWDDRLSRLKDELVQIFDAGGGSFRSCADQLRPKLRDERDDDDNDLSDDETIVAASTDPLQSSKLGDQVKQLAKRACYEPIDSRIVEHLIEWWQTPSTSFLCLELPVAADNDIGALTCAAFYACARRPKLIYRFEAFPPENEAGEAASKVTQTLDMIYSLIEQAVQQLPSTTNVPPNLPDNTNNTTTPTPENTLATARKVIKYLAQLLRLLGSSTTVTTTSNSSSPPQPPIITLSLTDLEAVLYDSTALEILLLLREELQILVSPSPSFPPPPPSSASKRDKSGDGIQIKAIFATRGLNQIFNAGLVVDAGNGGGGGGWSLLDVMDSNNMMTMTTGVMVVERIMGLF